MKQYDKIFIPDDKDYLQEQSNVIVLTKQEYYKELYFKQDFAIQQTLLIELEHQLRNIRDLLSGEPSEENVSEAYSIVNKFLRQKLNRQKLNQHTTK